MRLVQLDASHYLVVSINSHFLILYARFSVLNLIRDVLK